MHILLQPQNELLLNVISKDSTGNPFSWAIATGYIKYRTTWSVAFISQYDNLSVQNSSQKNREKGMPLYMLCTLPDDVMVSRFYQIKLLYYKRIIQLKRKDGTIFRQCAINDLNHKWNGDYLYFTWASLKVHCEFANNKMLAHWKYI